MKAYYFTADWCGPCQTFGPVMDQVTSIQIVKVNVDYHADITRDYAVMSVPTVVLLNSKGLELSRFSGARDLGSVNHFIDSYQGV